MDRHFIGSVGELGGVNGRGATQGFEMLRFRIRQHSRLGASLPGVPLACDRPYASPVL